MKNKYQKIHAQRWRFYSPKIDGCESFVSFERTKISKNSRHRKANLDALRESIKDGSRELGAILDKWFR